MCVLLERGKELLTSLEASGTIGNIPGMTGHGWRVSKPIADDWP